MGRGSAAPFAPSQNSGGEDRRHPPRGRRRVPTWPVDQNHIPRDLVYVVRQVVDPNLAVREQQILDRPALVFDLASGRREQLFIIFDLGRVRHVVCFGGVVRMGLFEPGDQELALVEEDGAAVVIEGEVEEGLVGEPKNEEIAGRCAESGEGGGYGGDLWRGHVGCRRGVRRSGVVKKSIENGRLEWDCGGGREGGVGEGLWDGGVYESESECEGEEGEEEEQP